MHVKAQRNMLDKTRLLRLIYADNTDQGNVDASFPQGPWKTTKG